MKKIIAPCALPLAPRPQCTPHQHQILSAAHDAVRNLNPESNTHLWYLNWQEISVTAHETRESLQQFRFSSSAKNWGVHAKLIYKYQILYLDLITIVAWHHFVNDRLVSQPEIVNKIYTTSYFGV